MTQNRALPFLLFGIFVAYFAAGQIAIQAHTDPGEMDTTAYLSAALKIKETGGVLRHIPNCLNGVYREAVQHPLYLLLLSPVAVQNIQFFVKAKILTFWIGLIFVAVFFWCLRDIWDERASIAACLFLLTAATFFHMTTMVACESLFALFFIVFWYLTIKGFEDGKYWFWAGVAAGLTFLSKSLGILTIPIFILSVLVNTSLRGAKRQSNLSVEIASPRRFAPTLAMTIRFFIGFIIFTWPLFIRNLKVYGTPLYSESSYVLWLDRWHDYLSPQIHEKAPTFFSYLKEHSASQIFKTFVEGLYVRDIKMLVDGLKPFVFWRERIDLNSLQGFHQATVSWQGFWALGILMLAVAGLWKARKQPEFFVTLISIAFFLIFVGWYSKIFPGTPPTRLLYPILFLLWAFAARALSVFLNVSLLRGLAGLFLIIYLMFLHLHFDWKNSNIRRSYSFNPVAATQIAWVRDNLKSGDKILAGNLFSNTAFYFKSGLRAEYVDWPTFGSMDEFRAYADKNSIRYAIVDMATAVYNGALFQEYFEVSPRTGMSQKKPLPSFFKLIPKDPRIPPLYEIYELEN